MRPGLMFCGFLVLALAVFFPSLHGEFIMDDWGYITQNPHITDTLTPLHFWFSFDSGPDYWPLAYTFYWIFYRLFGLNPLGYHLVNVALHSFNAVLVFVLARKFAPKMALWAALLFLLHPLQVQAVSWIIQFKTLLSTAFALGTVLLYFERRLTEALILFALSLLSKSSSIFLPFALFILEWHGDKWKVRLRRLAPFFALSFIGGLTTMWSNYLNFDELDAYVFHMRWFERPLLMIQSLMFYLSAFVWPLPLAYIYPHIVPSLYAWTMGFFAILIVIGAIILTRVTLLKGVRAHFLAYLILLVPCLGLVAIPNMKLSLVADHWAYFSHAFMGIFVACLLEKIPWKWPAYILAVTALVPLAWLAHLHARTFASEESFWRQARELNPESPAPFYNLGTSYDKKERYKEAAAQYEEAIKVDPLHARAWYNLGRDQFLLGNPAGAREGFEKAIELNPKIPVAYISLSKVHMALLNKEKAIQVVKHGLTLNPDNPELVKWLAEIEKAEL